MSDEKTVIDDLLVLGNAVPDIISDNRITVCTAGYSETHGLVRIYPVPPVSHMKRWNVVKVPLERNPADTRAESWKIQGSKAEWERIADKIELKGVLTNKNEKFAILDEILGKFGVGCVEVLNERLSSLGVIKPESLSCELVERDDHEQEMQSTLDNAKPFLTIKNYPHKPIASYRCPSCKTKNPHRQQIMEWGVFEWMRKNPKEPEKVFENLHIGESGYYTSLLVGNMVLHRNSFMVISVFRLKLPS
jgi:hypothetical protein